MTTDSYFSSPVLSMALYEEGMYHTGKLAWDTKCLMIKFEFQGQGEEYRVLVQTSPPLGARAASPPVKAARRGGL